MLNLEELSGLLAAKCQKLRENTGRLELWGIGALILLILASGLFLFARNRPSPVPAVKELKEEEALGKLNVHVAGAVVKPGVYELAEGKRVVDAIERAGGALPEADLDNLNLAAKVVDGQKVFVFKKGETAASVSSSGSESRIALNSATAEQLDKLPGIGEVLAKRIVEWREARGRFNKLQELMEVEGIGAKKFDELRDRITLD